MGNCYKHDCFPRKQNQVVLNCGTGTGIILPQHKEKNSQLINPYVIASVALDTRGLEKPTVKIEFSSIVTYKEKSFYGLSDLRLTFQLSKVCKGAKIPLGTWNYERDVDFSFNLTAERECGVQPQNATANGIKLKVDTVDSFSFNFCECQDCPDCCHYFVELINVESYNVDFASVTQAVITAMAVGPMDRYDD